MYVQKFVASDLVILVKETGTENVADFGTKALDKWTIWNHIEVLGCKRLHEGNIVGIPRP